MKILAALHESTRGYLVASPRDRSQHLKEESFDVKYSPARGPGGRPCRRLDDAFVIGGATYYGRWPKEATRLCAATMRYWPPVRSGSSAAVLSGVCCTGGRTLQGGGTGRSSRSSSGTC